jgi:hypothetical protein
MSKVAAPPLGQPSSIPVKVPHDKIAMRAYEKWIKRGRPHGTHVQDWLEAERELQRELQLDSSRIGTMPSPRR